MASSSVSLTFSVSCPVPSLVPLLSAGRAILFVPWHSRSPPEFPLLRSPSLSAFCFARLRSFANQACLRWSTHEDRSGNRPDGDLLMMELDESPIPLYKLILAFSVWYIGSMKLLVVLVGQRFRPLYSIYLLIPQRASYE